MIAKTVIQFHPEWMDSNGFMTGAIPWLKKMSGATGNEPFTYIGTYHKDDEHRKGDPQVPSQSIYHFELLFKVDNHQRIHKVTQQISYKRTATITEHYAEVHHRRWDDTGHGDGLLMARYEPFIDNEGKQVWLAVGERNYSRLHPELHYLPQHQRRMVQFCNYWVEQRYAQKDFLHFTRDGGDGDKTIEALFLYVRDMLTDELIRAPEWHVFKSVTRKICIAQPGELAYLSKLSRKEKAEIRVIDDELAMPLCAPDIVSYREPETVVDYRNIDRRNNFTMAGRDYILKKVSIIDRKLQLLSERFSNGPEFVRCRNTINLIVPYAIHGHAVNGKALTEREVCERLADIDNLLEEFNVPPDQDPSKMFWERYRYTNNMALTALHEHISAIMAGRKSDLFKTMAALLHI